jgi:hypothetical protein
VERVRLHADLTILAQWTVALNQTVRALQAVSFAGRSRRWHRHIMRIVEDIKRRKSLHT